MENVNATQALLHKLNLRGVGIANDDFGTGFSSLQYLRNFSVDKLKIDRSVVSNIDTEPEALSIILPIADLGSNLGKSTITEGVETQAQLEIVQELGCNEIQGYLISRPCPAADLLEFVGSSFSAWESTCRQPSNAVEVRAPIHSTVGSMALNEIARILEDSPDCPRGTLLRHRPTSQGCVIYHFWQTLKPRPEVTHQYR